MKISRNLHAAFIALLLVCLFAVPLSVTAEEGPVSSATETGKDAAATTGQIGTGEQSAPVVGQARKESAPAIEEFIPQGKLLPLSLEECLCIAVANNLEIEIEGYLPRINAAEILSQKGTFDPHLFFSAVYVDSTIPLTETIEAEIPATEFVGLTSIELKQWTLSGGLTGAISSGLFYEATITSTNTPKSTITEFFNTNGQEEFETVLTLSQPLLKNFGVDINTTGIRSAEKGKEASVYQLKQTVIDTLFAVEQAYWNLVFAYENLKVRLNSLQLARNLLEENKIRLKVGVVAPLDVLQSETGVASREEEVIIALSAVERASDTLISLMNPFPERYNWDVQIYPTDSVVVSPPAEYSEQAQLGLALRERPDLKALILQREIAQLQAKYAKNQLLPALNLNASVGLIGLDTYFNPLTAMPPPFPHTGIDRAWDNLVSGDNVQWMLGFTFETPLGEHFERGQYRSATLQVSQLDTTIQNARLLIIQDIRSALRQIQTWWEQVQTSKVVTEYRRKYLEAEHKRYQVGVTTTFDLLRYENDLAQAEASEINNMVQYQISLANLNRANGMLLKVLDVQMSVDP